MSDRKSGLEALKVDNRFAGLSECYFSRVQPTPLENVSLASLNHDAARLIGLDPGQVTGPELAAVFNGDKPFPGADPLAMLYAGHQFGHYVQQLGDGRAILLGQVRNRAGDSWDLQVKGAGLTPYSREGDGRAVLRSTIREYLCSEAMHGLGIPTTRALCVITSPAEVYRERIESAALLVRLSPSHVRFGSFEVFYYREQYHLLGALADHVLDEHYPELAGRADRYQLWLRAVIDRTASLVARWQAVGFAHGVLNTDNMSVLGLTLDYGPYGFLDVYDPGFVCNHSDHRGRYAFARQPDICLWNLSCFAQAILPLLSDTPALAGEIAKGELQAWTALFADYYRQAMAAKLGLTDASADDDALVAELLALMAKDRLDYTIFFRQLADSFAPDSGVKVRDHFVDRETFDAWERQYQARLQQEDSSGAGRCERMRQVNPAIVMRNHIAQIAIEKAEQGDFSEVDRLLALFRDPYGETAAADPCAGYPPSWATEISVSCSS